MSAERSRSSLAGELESLRLENETLSGIVGVVTSGPDLAHILDRVVDLLTGATSSHACFVYLRAGDRLVLRAASPIYAHLVGKIAFGSDEGLVGWTMRHREPAFIRDGAIDDPRTVYVPELEEERFQSMVAVPIPSREGESIGAIVLHTVAPREFDEGILNVLSRAASLVAGAIENARLYEDARDRVEALTKLSGLGREIAAVADHASLSRVAAAGIRDLIGADLCRIYERDGQEAPLRRVAADPAAGEEAGGEELEAIAALPPTEWIEGEALAGLADALGMAQPPLAASAVSLDAGAERTATVLVAAREPFAAAGPELLRAGAQQLALALEKVRLIERLTEENLAHDLFDALAAGQLDVAAEKAAAAGLDLARPHVVFEVRPVEESAPEPWSQRGAEAERAIKRALPATFCDLTSAGLRGLTIANAAGVEPARRAIAALSPAAGEGLAIGVSEAQRTPAGIGQGLREAADAARIAVLLRDEGEAVLYRDTGAYRYLVDMLDSGGPHDHLRAAVDEIAAYDRERGSQLLVTLDEYLSHGRSVAATARALFIHVNTLRQRLDRIETLTGLKLADEDLLALQLAVKLGRVRS